MGRLGKGMALLVGVAAAFSFAASFFDPRSYRGGNLDLTRNSGGMPNSNKGRGHRERARVPNDGRWHMKHHRSRG